MSTLSAKESLAIHAHALCNITALNNAFVKTLNPNNPTLKLSNCQAYELLAKFAGYKSFNGLKAQINEDTSLHSLSAPNVAREHLQTIFDPSNSSYKFLEHRIFEYLMLQNFQLHPIHDENFAYALAYTHPSKWHEVCRTFLDLNLVKGNFMPNFMCSYNLTMLYSANLLSLYTQNIESHEEFEELAQSGELETRVVAFKNAPPELSNKLAEHSNTLGFHVLHHFNTKSFAYMRSIMYYIAKTQNVVPVIKQTESKMADENHVNNAKLEAIHKKVYNKLADAAKGESNYSRFKHVEGFNNASIGYLPQINEDRTVFLQIVQNFHKLSDYFDQDSWVSLDACPKGVPVVMWNEYAVSYMNAFLDYMVMFFDRFVQNKRFNLNNIYINKAAMFMLKSENPITFKHPDTKEVLSLSANDFSILMNCHISKNLVNRAMDVTTFSIHMGLALHKIALEALKTGKGVDSADTLKHAIESLS